MRLSKLTYLPLCALLLVGCTHEKKEVIVQTPPPPARGDLGRTLDMVDKDGRHYGTVEMNPVGGGKVFDADGRLIGDIVPPER